MQNSKNYLNVPYAEKDQAKALGARWDAAKKKWYAPANLDLPLFAKWLTGSSANSSSTKGKASKVISGVTTYARDKNFIAYSGDKPPWD
ncbi:MAG: hypothetical protein DRQ62_08210 [Gammaproteobacteria bacterium]|nr:MAG: hypothetical protein DRQ62_08210 [Gammaproteobacteria bacterium]